MLSSFNAVQSRVAHVFVRRHSAALISAKTSASVPKATVYLTFASRFSRSATAGSPPDSNAPPIFPSSRDLNHPVKFVMPKRRSSPRSKVLILGAGNFGSCLADHLGDSQHDVFMWSREKKFVMHFNLYHRNPDYLKSHVFSTNIEAVGPDMPGKEFLKDMDVLLFAIPTQGLRYTTFAQLVSSI